MWFAVGEGGTHPESEWYWEWFECASAATAPWWCRFVFGRSGKVGAMCVTQRGVGLPGSDDTNVMFFVIQFPTTPPLPLPFGREAPPQWRSSGPHTRSSGPRHVPPRNKGSVSEPLPGAGVGPSSAGTEVGNKSVNYCRLGVMSPEDFAKYQVLVTPKPNREKSWNRSCQTDEVWKVCGGRKSRKKEILTSWSPTCCVIVYGKRARSALSLGPRFLGNGSCY